MRVCLFFVVVVVVVFFLNGNVFSETRIGVREKFALARLFSCDLDVEKASEVKTASERN